MKNPYTSINQIKGYNITDAQNALFHGLIELWKSKPLYKISVKELSEVSHIARSTFYVYYQNVNELVEDIENYHINQLLDLNKNIINKEIPPESYLSYYQETINYVQRNEDLFYAFLVANINNSFIDKWKNAIKYHLYEREYLLSCKNNYPLVLEMISSEVIAAYIFYLKDPEQVDIKSIDKVVTQTLKSIEF